MAVPPTSLAYILITCFVISTLALAGFLSIMLARRSLENVLMVLVSFAAGTLLGGAFFHLLPESVEQGGPTFPMAVAGIVVFFAIEMFLYSFIGNSGIVEHRHAHHHIKPVGVLNLFGDGVHNVTDGIIVASSFLVSIDLGVITSIAIALHEIPQEIGDFAILLHSGYGRRKALALNYAVALSIFAGALAFVLFAERVTGLTRFTVPFAAGGFIYIAAADLLGEIKEEAVPAGRKLLQFGVFILGIALLWYLRQLLGE
ncbi:MAG: ZIP family metal transporter [Actinobacteria bacterium]|nr:MAG: ZIP family metal transporter [Actinomycetota bacterium]